MPDKASFEDWMRQVDAEVLRGCGMTTSDLADCAYRDWYDGGVSPMTAAKRAIRAS